MAKINMMTHLDSFSGKYHHTDKVYTKIRKFDEQVIGVRLKNSVTNVSPSEKQAAVQLGSAPSDGQTPKRLQRDRRA